jgi:hypothetical protein
VIVDTDFAQWSVAHAYAEHAELRFRGHWLLAASRLLDLDPSRGRRHARPGAADVRTRVVVADDSSPYLELLILVLGELPEVEVVGMAGDGRGPSRRAPASELPGQPNASDSSTSHRVGPPEKIVVWRTADDGQAPGSRQLPRSAAPRGSRSPRR